MSQATKNLGLYLEDDGTTSFKEWREKMNGPSGSNMEKIDDAVAKKQNKLTGTVGQVVGFDADGNAVAQAAPDTGVTAFKGRTGAVVPQSGDYTAEQVGALASGATAVASEKLAAPKSIDGVNFDGSASISHYVTCNTPAATTAKIVSLSGFVLAAGAKITVKFTNNNTASDPTLNVNGTGAKAIKKYGEVALNTYMWQAGAVVEFVYDGTNWIMQGGTTATTTYYGVTRLNSSTSSTSTTEAATPSAVKAAYDAAQSKVPVTRTVNGKALSADISLTANDVGARPSTWVPSCSELKFSTATKAVALGGANAFGINSVAMGFNANADSPSSTAVGSSANASNSNATALGHCASVSGANSVALGVSASAIISNSTAVGFLANASKNSTTALGAYAKANGNHSTALGYCASVSGCYSVALGNEAVTANSNSIQLGNASNLGSLTCLKSLTVTSDERDKTDIHPIDNAVDFLKRVRTFSYVRNDRELYNKPEEELSDAEQDAAQKYGFTPYDKQAHAEGTLKRERRRVGVSAQAVRQALIDTFGTADGADLVNDNLHDFDPAEIPEWVESHLGVTYEKFIPFLIRAVQELDTRIKALEVQNA